MPTDLPSFFIPSTPIPPGTKSVSLLNNSLHLYLLDNWTVKKNDIYSARLYKKIDNKGYEIHFQTTGVDFLKEPSVYTGNYYIFGETKTKLGHKVYIVRINNNLNYDIVSVSSCYPSKGQGCSLKTSNKPSTLLFINVQQSGDKYLIKDLDFKNPTDGRVIKEFTDIIGASDL